MDPQVEPVDALLVRARARVGTVLRGKYRLDRVLGVGGMASVYAATHLRNANRVAVKILHRELAIDADLRARFLREGYAANTVEHSGTARILDDDVTEDGAVFLVMELLDGETLDARWERSGRKLGVKEVSTMMGQLLDVLASAHAKGIVHRDIKPENLFLTKTGELKVLDFGVARLREASPTQTKTGAVFGTPAFMPPEQALGRSREVDALSDLWAVGATAFALLSGRYVHSGVTAEETLVYSATRPAPSLVSVAPHVPLGLAQVIDRALAFEKADRWPSAQAMKEALTRVRGVATPMPVGADDWDAETRLAPPPQMTMRGNEASRQSVSSETTLALPTLHPGSTVAGVASHSEARRVRRERRLIGAGAGGLLLLVVVGIVVALATGSKGSLPNVPASAIPSAAVTEPVGAPSFAAHRRPQWCRPQCQQTFWQSRLPRRRPERCRQPQGKSPRRQRPQRVRCRRRRRCTRQCDSPFRRHPRNMTPSHPKKTMRSTLVLFALMATGSAARTALASDPSPALDELKQGYALKQQGNCREAVAHFTRSFELDPKPKALLNLSDCEQQMGDFVTAQDHAAYGRQLSQQQSDAELTAAADKQLAAIDKRLPRLTIKLSSGAPAESVVSRDGVVVERSSLGVAVGINPGAHTIVVAAPGHVDRRFLLTLAEGAREQLEVAPGPRVRVEVISAEPPDSAQKNERRTVSRLLTYGALGVGAVGMTIGIATGIAATSKHDALQSECKGNECLPSAQGDLDGFHSQKTVSTISYVVGAAGLIGGAGLWFFTIRDRSTGEHAHLWIGPSSAGVGGVF